MRLLITEEFKELFSDEFEQKLIQSAYARFNDLNDPLRCNLFSLISRELIRILLVRIAPDQDVISTNWFNPSVNNGKPTRADRLRYALIGRTTDNVVAKHATLDVSNHTKDLVGIVNNLSKYAHISPGTVGLSIVSSNKYLEDVEDGLIQFCVKYFEIRDFIKRKIYEITHEEINQKLINEIPCELDALSSNTIFDYAYIEQVEGININSTSMSITGHGQVEIELNYGSSDDGYSSDDSYPFDFEAKIDPETLKIDEISVIINTDSFYE